LYSQFANQTTQTLTGKVNEASAVANNAANNNQAVSDAKEDSSMAFLEAVRMFLILASFAVGYSAGL
jgi:hypothetical protein